MASDHIGDGLGGFVVEGVAALTILAYLAFLWFSNRWNQKFSSEGFYYSALTGVCVGAGTVAFFLLLQTGGPLSSVPVILAGGAAIMAVAGIVFFHEPASWQRLLGVGWPSRGFSYCGAEAPRRQSSLTLRLPGIDYTHTSRLRGETSDGFDNVHTQPHEPRRALPGDGEIFPA